MSYREKLFTRTDGATLQVKEKDDWLFTVTKDNGCLEGRTYYKDDMYRVLDRFLHYHDINLKSIVCTERYDDENMG